MIANIALLAGLAIAASTLATGANAGPITAINISLPANPDARIRVANSDSNGSFSGRVRATAGLYSVFTSCVEVSPCERTRITSLRIDGRAVVPSEDGEFRLTIRNSREAVSVRGTVGAVR